LHIERTESGDTGRLEYYFFVPRSILCLVCIIVYIVNIRATDKLIRIGIYYKILGTKLMPYNAGIKSMANESLTGKGGFLT
jgi:hypothetical protein